MTRNRYEADRREWVDSLHRAEVCDSLIYTLTCTLTYLLTYTLTYTLAYLLTPGVCIFIRTSRVTLFCSCVICDIIIAIIANIISMF